MPKSTKQWVEIEGRKLELSNLDKLMYPAAKFSKADVIDYYIRVAPFLLPHLKDRPVTMVRYPDGITGKFFYEKDAPKFTPEWVKTLSVPRRAGGKLIRYILINDLATLVWCANLASLELHPFLHHAPHIDRPDSVVFDLDPGEGADILNCAEIAFRLRDLLEGLKLKAFAKVSGSKGLQIYLPLNTPVTYEISRSFAHAVAQHLAREDPKHVIAEMDKAARRGKVFVDWSQNSDFKTTSGVYSLRTKRPEPFVSFPVTWATLEQAARKQSRDGLFLQTNEALERLNKEGDLFATVLKLKQRITAAVKQIEEKPVAGSGTRTRSRPLQ